MDPKIAKLIEICGFEEDPLWKEYMNKLFDKVTFKDYQNLLKNRDKLVMDTLLSAKTARPVSKASDLESCIDKTPDAITTKEPVLITDGLSLPEQGIRIGQFSVYLGEGVTLRETVINSPAYICDGARIEYSSLQSANRCNFAGNNTVISNVQEMRGCFVSGGPLRKKGRKQIYLHCRSINNLIIGAYTGMSVGVDAYNHPLGLEPSIVIDPETMKPHKFPEGDKHRKLPILVGLEAVLGAGVLLNSGAVIGANTVVPNRAEADGLVYLDEKGEQKYIPAREEKRLD